MDLWSWLTVCVWDLGYTNPSVPSEVRELCWCCWRFITNVPFAKPLTEKNLTSPLSTLFLSSFNATFYGNEEWNTSSMYVGWHANNIFAPIWLLPISQFPHACLLDSCLFVNTNQFDSIGLRLSGRGASWYVFSLFLANKSRPTLIYMGRFCS